MPESPRTRTGRLVVAAAVVDRLPHRGRTAAAPGGAHAATRFTGGPASSPTRATPRTLLCAARSYPAEHAGQYEFPGGKVEPGETPAAALARELAEELNLRVRLGAEVPPTPDLAVPPAGHADAGRFPDDGLPAWPAMHGYRMRVWLAEPIGPPRLGEAHAALTWAPLDEVDALPWLPADQPILKAVLRMLAHPTC